MTRQTVARVEISVTWGNYVQKENVSLALEIRIVMGRALGHPVTLQTADNAVLYVQKVFRAEVVVA